MDIPVPEHRGLFLFGVPSCPPGPKILLVTEVDFMVSLICLEWAPLGCIGYVQSPIIANDEAHFSHSVLF